MNKRTAIKELGKEELTFTFSHEELNLLNGFLSCKGRYITMSLKKWYQIQSTLKSIRGERKQCLNTTRKCGYKWANQIEDEIEAYSKLIKKIDVGLYEFEAVVQEKLDEQPKWIQRQARNPVPGSYGSAFK